MPAVNPHRRRRSRWGFLFMVLATVSVVGAGLVFTLWVMDVPLAFWNRSQSVNPYMVRIPINVRPIPAYSQVDRTDLIDSQTGWLKYQQLPPNTAVGMSISGRDLNGALAEGKVVEVKKADDELVFAVDSGAEIPHSRTETLGGALINVNSILGRVVKRDKRAGLGFREETFFPLGTPEGIAGATPAGMRAVTLDATKLTGVHALNAGDRIDLMANVPISEIGSFNSQYNSRLPGAALVASDSTDGGQATEPVLLAQDALVLKPVYVRNEATMSSSLTQGKRIQNVPKYEIALAVAPDDVIPLQSALNKNLKITCIVRSMQPSDGEPILAADRPTELMAPVTVRAILAYDVVTRDAFVSPATRRLRMEPVSREQADRLGIVTSVNDALGAIARHDIRAGRFVRKSDLLSGVLEAKTPVNDGHRKAVDTNDGNHVGNGTRDSVIRLVSDRHERISLVQSPVDSPAATIVDDRPAITRFVPTGHTAFAIPWNRLYGAEHLQIGDRIDLLASFSLESEDEEEETESRPDGSKIVRKRHDISTRETLRTWDESFGHRGEPWFVASDALVVGPVGFPAPAAAQRALGPPANQATANGADGPDFAGPPVLVAVDDRDVEAVAAALATRRALFTPAFRPSSESSAASIGMKRIAIAAQDIEPFVQFSETVWNGNRRRPLARLVKSDDPRFAGALTIDQMKDFEFRVLKKPKRRGEFFVADDFLPDGIEPGIAAAAGPGTSLFAVADQEIEGLDAFQANDLVAIIIRGVVKPRRGVVTHGVDLERPISNVIVPSARIVRASRGGQTVLEVSNEDLTRLQAAWAASMHANTEEGSGRDGRSHLLAVSLPRGDSRGNHRIPGGDAEDRAVSHETTVAKRQTHGSNSIPGFDPLGEMKVVEAVVGRRKQVHIFAGGDNLQAADENNSFNLVGQ